MRIIYGYTVRTQTIFIESGPATELGCKIIILFETIAPTQILIPPKQDIGLLIRITIRKINR